MGSQRKTIRKNREPQENIRESKRKTKGAGRPKECQRELEEKPKENQGESHRNTKGEQKDISRKPKKSEKENNVKTN